VWVARTIRGRHFRGFGGSAYGNLHPPIHFAYNHNPSSFADIDQHPCRKVRSTDKL